MGLLKTIIEQLQAQSYGHPGHLKKQPVSQRNPIPARLGHPGHPGHHKTGMTARQSWKRQFQQPTIPRWQTGKRWTGHT